MHKIDPADFPGMEEYSQGLSDQYFMIESVSSTLVNLEWYFDFKAIEVLKDIQRGVNRACAEAVDAWSPVLWDQSHD